MVVSLYLQVENYTENIIGIIAAAQTHLKDCVVDLPEYLNAEPLKHVLSIKTNNCDEIKVEIPSNTLDAEQ